MNRQLSIYLDFLRISAAVTVFLGHLSWQRLSGGALWWVQPFGHLAVIVFFVLSGFVIKYVVDVKETRLSTYSLARFSRLYSVIIPAILLTLLCDNVGMAIRPEVYLTERASDQMLRAVGGAFFLSQSWGWNLSMLSNDAFWSMPYEFWYYQIFAGSVFLRGYRRIRWVAVCMLIAGPAIWLYLPIWLMGVAAFACVERFSLKPWLAHVLFWGTAVMLMVILVLEYRGTFARSTAPEFPPGFAWIDYVVGLLVATHLLAMPGTRLSFGSYGRFVTYAASFTFSLYLFHLPLLHLAAALTPETWPVWLRGSVLGGATVLVVFVLGHLTEHQKHRWARWLSLGLGYVHAWRRKHC